MHIDVQKLLEIISTHELKDTYYRNVQMDYIRFDMFQKYVKPYIDEINEECNKVAAYPKFLKCCSYFHRNKERVCLNTNYPEMTLYYFESGHLFNNVTKFHQDFEMIKQQAIEKALLIGQVKKANDQVIEELKKALLKEDFINDVKQIRVSSSIYDYNNQTLKQRFHFRYKGFDLGYIQLHMFKELTEEKKEKTIRLNIAKFRKAFMDEMSNKLVSINNVNMVNKQDMLAYAKYVVKTKNVYNSKKIYKCKNLPEDLRQLLEGMAVASRLMK